MRENTILNKNLFLLRLVFLVIIGTFSVTSYVFADMTAEELMKETMTDDMFIIKKLSSDGSVTVLVGTDSPKLGSFWSMYVTFADAKSGAVIRNVNYDLLVTQENSLIGNKNIPEDIGAVTVISKKDIRHDYIEFTENFPHMSRDYLFSNEPINIMITLQGIGVDKKSGPIGDVIMMTIGQQNSKEICRPVALDYSMKYGSILDTCYEKDIATLAIEIKASADDQITIDIPKRLVYSIDDLNCKEGQTIFTLLDGEVIEPKTIPSKTANKITIPIQKGTHQIEFISTFPVPDPSPSKYCGIVMDYDAQYLPPKLQSELGVKPALIRCNQGMELTIKTSDGTPICVTSATKSKLIDRNWITTNIALTSSHDPKSLSDMVFGSLGDGNGQFKSPSGIEIDSSGNIYVVDPAINRVQKFSPDGVYQLQLGNEGSNQGEFNVPIDVAVDSSDNIYVTDNNNNRIQKFDSSGKFVSQIATAKAPFDTPYSFYPNGIAVDSSDNIYVTDSNNNRIQKFDSSGELILDFYFVDVDSDGLSIQEKYALGSIPGGIDVDSSDNVYVVDQTLNRIQKFDSSGKYIMQFGIGGKNQGKFENPFDVAIDSAGSIYVADGNNHRIQKFDSSGKYISQLIAGETVPDGFFPVGIAVDSSDNIYVTDNYDYHVYKFDKLDFE